MKNIAFSHTTPQFLAGTKTVTRRQGWLNLKPGTILRAVRKSQGLARGEKVRRLGVIEVLNVRREPIVAITAADVAREGFPGMSAPEFVVRYCESFHIDLSALVTRIEFRRIPT